MQFRARFHLKTIFAVTAFAAVSIASCREYQRHLERNQLRRLRDGFLRWSRSVDERERNVRSNFHLNSATDLSIVNRRGNAFLVANHQMELDSAQNTVIFRFNNRPDGKRFYILPAETWVESADEVIEKWNEWHGANY